MIKLIHVDTDSREFTELYKRVMVLYYNKDLDQKDIPLEYTLEVLLELADGAYCVHLVDEDKQTELFCVYDTGYTNPHYLGRGLSTVSMFSTGYNPRLYRKLYKYLVSVALETGCLWLSTEHKIRKGVYETRMKRI